MASAIFSPLLPTTYPPNPISSKSQNREVSANMGKLVKVPISTITANINITNGRHERCSQFPAASALITPARASIISRSRSYTNLNISACNPEALLGVDPDRLTRASRSETAIQPYVNAVMSNGCPWCVASVPIPSWAKKVFPDLPEQEEMDRVWDAIFTSVRISGKGDAVARWREHTALLRSRVDKLNALHFESLYYENSLGTRLNIRLPEKHVWSGGSNLCRAGYPFVANMPTEEVFTAPLKTGIDGVVYSAMPLVHNGNIIENFHFVIKDGRIVDVHAEKGEDILRAAIAEDEGASYFGEVALVPYDSPISNQKILFYNTLFDENAACHLAFGEAYPECVEGGEAMSTEERKAAGLNDSNTHVDFMIGTSDLSIIGTTKDGREVPVFVNGNFAL